MNTTLLQFAKQETAKNQPLKLLKLLKIKLKIIKKKH